jgi:hypothetical protein
MNVYFTFICMILSIYINVDIFENIFVFTCIHMYMYIHLRIYVYMCTSGFTITIVDYTIVVDFLCSLLMPLIGRVYVFYVGHVDKSILYEILFHCNILSKHHHHHHQGV